MRSSLVNSPFISINKFFSDYEIIVANDEDDLNKKLQEALDNPLNND